MARRMARGGGGWGGGRAGGGRCLRLLVYSRQCGISCGMWGCGASRMAWLQEVAAMRIGGEGGAGSAAARAAGEGVWARGSQQNPTTLLTPLAFGLSGFGFGDG